MKLLDLYCCQGGASSGYVKAGFTVTGIDLYPQPKYPYHFIQSDAIDYLLEHGHKYNFIHASPPCQGYSNLTPESHKGKYKKSISDLRKILCKLNIPYCIENVAGAKSEMINPLVLCGSMFNLRTQRHRLFETSFKIGSPRKCDHSLLPLLVTTASKASREKRFKLGIKPKSVSNSVLAYGIDWMDFNGLKECIPPAYTEYIGLQYLITIPTPPNKDGYN